MHEDASTYICRIRKVFGQSVFGVMLRGANGIGAHYPFAIATDDLKQKFGGIEGLPTTMLYDRVGVLRMKVIGFEYTDNIESTLKPLL